jgi:DNA-binding transcriptional ArsR family regulator
MNIDKRKMKKNAEQAAALLKQLAHPARLLILCQLIEHEKTAGELVADSGLGQSACSQHLAKLREAKLVRTRKEAQTVYYQLANATVITLLETMYKIYCH